MPIAANAASTAERRSLRRPLRMPAPGISCVELMKVPFECGSGRLLGGGRFFETPAERADEIDGQVELAEAQIGLEVLLIQHLCFRCEHLQIVAEPGAVARDRDAVGLFGGAQARPG